jgi:hypothetical protein
LAPPGWRSSAAPTSVSWSRASEPSGSDDAAFSHSGLMLTWLVGPYLVIVIANT